MAYHDATFIAYSAQTDGVAPVKSRNSRDLTIVSPSVKVERPQRRSARVACRSESLAARRAEPQPSLDQKFRYFVDSNGRQHFNFVQRVWLQPQVEMAVTPVPTVALTSNAVNLSIWC